jgi:hypothetical protein
MKRKCNFRREAVVPEGSKNQGTLEGSFYSIPALTFVLQKHCFFSFIESPVNN